MMTLLKRTVLGVFAVVLVVFAGASPVFAESPWWVLGSGSRPTVLQSGVARDEVQDVMVTETEGEFVLIEPVRLKEVEEGKSEELLFVVLPVTATPEEVQVGLETIYGAGNVAVTGSKPYVVTFRGGMRGQLVPLMLGFGATVTEAVKGRPDGQVFVTAANLGDASLSSGESNRVKIADVLPPGVHAVSIEGVAGNPGGENRGPVVCPTSKELGEGASPSCVFEKGTLPPFDQIEVMIGVVVEEGAKAMGEFNRVSVSGGEGYVCDEVAAGSGQFQDGFCSSEAAGGGFERVSTGVAPGASLRHPLVVGGAAAPFGVEDYRLIPEEEGGLPDTQAGSHPFQVSTTLTLNQTGDANPVAMPKDLYAKLPPGLIGNPTPFPKCTIGQFLTVGSGENHCSPDTAVGVAMVTIHRLGVGVETVTVPIFNLEPAVGEPARFGFLIVGVPALLDASVRAGGDYGVTLGSANISESAGLLSFKPTFWGVPGDPSHDNARSWGCLDKARGEPNTPSCDPLRAHQPPPLLSLPTSCPTNPVTLEPEPLHTSIEGDSWAEPKPPGERLLFPGEPIPAMDSCNRLQFAPEIKVSPDGQAASTPTGLTVDVHVPQDGQLNSTGLANSNIKDIAVTLPEGVALNPAAADGLLACSEAQVGYLPAQSKPPAELAFTPTLPDPLQQGINFCPDAAKVGTATIKSPLLPPGQFVQGAVYLATPAPEGEEGQNPFHSLVAMYIVAKDPISGTLIKLSGRVSLNPVTGQISATFENNPQLAFEDAEVHFFGGDRAPLATPARCGTYTTEGTFTPWSGNPPVKSQSSFEITSGPNGTPCPSPLPFNPSLTAGSINNQAGSFTPFTTTMSREDGQQNLQGIVLHMPPGLSGLLTGVKLCGETEANTGTCGPESLIGETTVSVGLGGSPFTVTGGKAYITGPYGGAPFGLSIVNPADAGPFHLGKVIVRTKIEVDPHTAALTVTTDNTGPYKIPQFIDGVPLQIKHVNVTINRPGFTFNPTNCSPLQITGSLVSVEGAISGLSVPFQATNCAVLKFAPKFKVSTSGKTSKAKGASLSVKLTYPKAPFGSQANIARVKVDLPKQLPSRLTTLQKACIAAQFESNPAGCPPASKIGYAKAITPLIPVPLEGPAIFVSHGGEAFPSLIMVLQGYGVTVDLVGTTFISKTGITSSTFKTVPDAPVGSFEVTLPQGKFSALAANGNLCKSASKLRMPTEFLAQNGAKINQSTKINVTGCHKQHKKTKHSKKNTGKHKNGKYGKKK